MNHLIIFAHPNSTGSFGRAIADRVIKTSQSLGVETQFRDLYTMDFNPIISFEELQAANKGIIPEEVKYEHELILQADLITLVYPLWWMGYPAILKGYLDRVLSYGFAYKTANLLACLKANKCSNLSLSAATWINTKNSAWINRWIIVW